MMSLPKCFQLQVYFHDIAIQNNKIDIGTWPSTFDSYVATGCVQQRFLMQLISNIRLSSLDKRDNPVATMVEVRDNVITKYVAWIGEPATSTHT